MLYNFYTFFKKFKTLFVSYARDAYEPDRNTEN